MQKSWRSALILLAATLSLTSITGCASTVKPARVQLPLFPADFAPVPQPRPVLNGDTRLTVSQHRKALKDANTRLMNARIWYEELVDEYDSSEEK